MSKIEKLVEKNGIPVHTLSNFIHETRTDQGVTIFHLVGARKNFDIVAKKAWWLDQYAFWVKFPNRIILFVYQCDVNDVSVFKSRDTSAIADICM